MSSLLFRVLGPPNLLSAYGEIFGSIPDLSQESIRKLQNPIGDEFDAFVNFENSCEFDTPWQNVMHGSSTHLIELEAPSGFNTDLDHSANVPVDS